MVDDLERMKLDEIKSKMNTAKFMAAGQAWDLLHSIFWLTTVSKEETFDGAEISAVGTFILRPAAVPVPISSEPPPLPNLLPPPFRATPPPPPQPPHPQPPTSLGLRAGVYLPILHSFVDLISSHPFDMFYGVVVVLLHLLYS